MVMTTTDRPIRAAEMGRTEAEQLTQAIKDNFDSLGAMLAMARDRKAYRALGYRSFKTYCQSEFGKSISSAYQLIEDAKVLSQLEARISEEYGENITLKFPSSHLKPLKEIDNIDDKLKAIEYANKLAAAENRKATKKDLEIAIFQISGKRSEDFRAAIQGLGFSRGVQVEVVKSLNRDRGWVTKVDKAGKIHVEFHYGSIVPIPYDAADLRILSQDEQPAKPLNESITSKGDRVSIFSPTLKGKEGTIFQWKSGKQALVMVDGVNGPIDIAYAEMELLKPEQKNTNWQWDLSWDTAKQTYYYFQKENLIYSNKWPAGLTLNPFSHELSPIDFMVNWEEKFAGELLEGLATPTNLKTLVLAQAIELPEDEGKEFVRDLVTSLSQLFPQVSKLIESKLEADRDTLLVRIAEAQNRYTKIRQQEVEPLEDRLIQLDSQLLQTAKELRDTKKELESTIEHSRQGLFQQEISKISLVNENLQIRLKESEKVIESMVNAASALEPEQTVDFLVEDTDSTASALEPEQTADFLVEDTDSTASALEPEQTSSWFEVLDSNGFTQGYIQFKQLAEEPTESYRGWNIYTYDSSVADISHSIKGIFSIDFSWAFKKEIIKPLEWLKNIINQVEDFCPGQLSLFPQPESTMTTEKSNHDNDAIIAAKRERIEKDLETLTQELLQTKNEKKTKKIRADIRIQESRLKDVDNFVSYRIGDSVIRNIFPDKKGIIDRLEISPTGLLSAWVMWEHKYEGEANLPEEHNIGTLTKISNVDGGEK